MPRKIEKPLLKWVGGKTQIIKCVINKFPKIIDNYYEIFLGGGSVLLALLGEIESKNITLKSSVFAYDSNPNLINFYLNVKNNPESLYLEVTKLLDNYQSASVFHKTKDNKELQKKIRNPESINDALVYRESYYYWIRKQYNNLGREEMDGPYSAALFIFLNKVGFRGMYRIGPNGFNVPYGHYKTVPKILDKNHLLRVSKMIQDVNFETLDFKQSIKKLTNSNNFVYLDPPYYPIKTDSFVNYNSDGFTQHKDLFNLCLDISQKKNNFMMSNSNTEYVVNYFKENHKIEFLECRRAINAKNPNSKAKEIIITNY